MKAAPKIPLLQLVTCLSDTVDLMSPAMASHHMRVAYIAGSIGRELGLPAPQVLDLTVAGAIHDIGGFSVQERVDLLNFDVSQPHHHARVGFHLLNTFPPLSEAARIIRFHHVAWADGAGSEFGGHGVPRASHILHLADRIAVQFTEKEPPLRQVAKIREKLAGTAGAKFMPLLLDVFMTLSCRDYFWMDIASSGLANLLVRNNQAHLLQMDDGELLGFAGVLRRLIDFRSLFTATHSSGVSASAVSLAKLAGFHSDDCTKMKVAGYLHDLGKLGIPREILEKPGKLDGLEYDIMRSHAYYSYRILEPVIEFNTIRDWGALHQEYLDGSGYPFGLSGTQLAVGSRIMAIADVFTALTEDRPYRAGMSESEAMTIILRLSAKGKLDADLVALIEKNSEEINFVRATAQRESVEEYREFIASVQ